MFYMAFVCFETVLHNNYLTPGGIQTHDLLRWRVWLPVVHIFVCPILMSQLRMFLKWVSHVVCVILKNCKWQFKCYEQLDDKSCIIFSFRE
jgi:hypothetical protein